MNYCSNCGHDKLEFIIPKGDNRSRYVCTNCGMIHYSNPKIVTGCLPIWKDKVLLAKRSIEPRKGYWNVPGGYMENGETAEEGAAREVWEETLAKVKVTGVHAIFSIPHINQVYIHFLGQLTEASFGVGPESLEVQLFTQAEIPWKDIAFISSSFTLKKYYEDLAKGIHRTHYGGFDFRKK